MPLPAFLAGIFAGKGKEIASTVVNGLDALFTSKEEKLAKQIEIEKLVNEHIEKMESLAVEETKLYLADTASARENNTKIQESDKASWLSKNVAYLLDIFVGALWGTITVILFLKVFKIAAQEVDMVSLMALHGTVTAVFMTIINFHRGSSIGSERKQRYMESLNQKTG